MRKPSFGVVTFVLTVLVLIGVLSQTLRPYIPAVPENAMEREREPFLRAGRLQPIPWQRLAPAAFAEARRGDRPVLLFVGIVASQAARQIDGSLTDRDVARFASRHFVCVRVDGLEHPEWVNVFLPVSRLKIGFQPEAQLWVLDPTGQPIHFIGRTTNDSPLHPDAILASLQEAQGRFERIRRGQDSVPAGALQEADRALLTRTPPDGRIDLAAYRQRIRDAVDRQTGGFPLGNLRQPRPLAHRFLLSVGDLATAREALDPMLTSPLLDSVEGGFFHVGVQPSPWQIEFDKWTSETAEMAHALALAYCLLRDPRYRDEATRCLDLLATTFTQDRFLVAGEVGHEYGRDRNARHSFPPRRLAELLTPEEVARAEAELTLDPAANPQMVPYLRSAPTPELSPILRKLSARPVEAEFAAAGYAEVHLGSLARAMQAARLLGDARRLRDLSQRLDATWAFFRTPTNDVRRRAEAEVTTLGGLSDYLAYADAKLQDYVATGHYVSFDDGLRVLRRATATFRRARGMFVASRRPEPGLPDPALPELADNFRESTTAQAIRLLLAYGRLLGDRPEGAEFLREAYAAVYRYGRLAQEGGVLTAGFFGAAAAAVDDAYAVCVGPKAQALANALARHCPTRLVAPAVGDLRRDLAAQGPGIYIVRGTARGPLTFEQAARLLPPTLETPN